jgi:hypothetical protein
MRDSRGRRAISSLFFLCGQANAESLALTTTLVIAGIRSLGRGFIFLARYRSDGNDSMQVNSIDLSG